ncbi:MAG TPA: hypothetical protein PKN33_21250 [Phycisphaerae bacterium]|nr:hypothetical protein [Phycisphaerae bacterium]
MSDRTYQQELYLRGELNLVVHSHVALFAELAAIAINRGRLYRFAQQIGSSPLEMTIEFGRDLKHLERVGSLSDTYGRPNAIEFMHATWLGHARHQLSMKTIVAAIESERLLLSALGPTGRFAMGLVEWRRLVSANEPPPAESIAIQLGHRLGTEVDEYSAGDVCRDLADALAHKSVGEDRLLEIVAHHRGAVISPELCDTLAKEAVSVAFQPASATAPASSSSGLVESIG